MYRFLPVFILVASCFSFGLYWQSGFNPDASSNPRKPTSEESVPSRLENCEFNAEKTPSRRMQLIAHRGDEQKHLENTFEALQSGLRSGVDFVETDIRKSKDGVFLIHHDGDTGNVTTCKDGEVVIAETNWDYLHNNCAYKNVSPKNQKINSLQEVLEMARFEKAGLVLDVKPEVKADDILKLADELLKFDSAGKCMKGEVVEGSFNCFRNIIVYINDYEAQNKLWRAAKGLDKADSKYSILANMTYLKIMGNPVDALKNPEKFLDHDGIAFHLGSASCETLQALRAIPGKLLVGWTLQTEAELQDARKVPLDGVVTSRLHDYLEFFKK